MSFSFNFSAASKDEAMHKLESAENVPLSVRAFIGAAIDGFKEPGGNHPHGHEKVGQAVEPVAIKVSANGHLDANGDTSTCSINVSKA